MEKCSKCAKTVRAGGVELGNTLFCGPCFAVKASEIQAAREAAAKAPAPAAPAFAKAPAKRERCEFYPAIREFMAVARTLGLDTNNKRGCRIAIGLLLGRRVESRADLSAADWGRSVGALRSGALWW